MIDFSSKTFWAGLAAIVAAVGGYFTGELPMAAAIQMGFTGVLGMTLKHAISKGL